MRYVIVGNSAAAVHAVEALRARDPLGRLTLVTAEAGPAYARVFLPELIRGARNREAIALRDPGFYARKEVEVRPEAAVALDPEARVVTLAGGGRLPYDRLLLATGSEPLLPDLPGLELEGVVTARTAADAAAIRGRARPGARVVVVGASWAGLKVAEALHGLGCRVTVSGRVLRRALDETAGRLLEAALSAAGVGLCPGLRARALRGRGRVEAVELADGSSLSASLVVLATGVRPNTGWLAESGLRLGPDGSVVTDCRLQSSAPGVWAAGDLAQTVELTSGRRQTIPIWPIAVEQGRVAGTNMAGGDECYAGGVQRNTGTYFGLAVATAGCSGGLPGATWRGWGPGPRGYGRIWSLGDRPVGMVCLGPVAATGPWVTALSRATAPWAAVAAGPARPLAVLSPLEFHPYQGRRW